MISCIVTTKNEEKVIGALLESVKGQSYKDTEIILVDNNSEDETKKIAEKFGAKVFNKGPERSVQRNFGVDKSRGKFVLILDADMVLTKNLLTDCYKKMRSGKFGALVIPEKSFGKGFWAKCKAFEREFYVGEESIEAARLFNKTTFRRFGGYDTTITGPEDYDLPLRMKKKGVRIGRINSYILHNEKKFSPVKSAKKKFYYASHARNYLKKHPEMMLKQGNLLFRGVFLRKWRKLLSKPHLAFGMVIVRILEMTGALSGIIYSVIIQKASK